jgi:quercetin dioxygenase-like cupin family protein
VIRYRWVWNADDDFSMQYEIPAGRGLPAHSHEPEALHDVHVISGLVEVITEEKKLIGGPGDTLNFDGTKTHTIHAIADSVIRNRFLNGIPESYKSLPLSEHSGAF